MSETAFQTSKEAYEYCKENGLLSERADAVLKALIDSAGPMNQTMVHNAIIRETGVVGMQKYSISPRFAVLERMGLIREVGEGPCPVSKRRTVFYEPTLNKPVMTEAQAENSAPDKKRTISDLTKRVAELEDENKKLRELLNMRSASFREREERIRNAPVEVQAPLFV